MEPYAAVQASATVCQTKRNTTFISFLYKCTKKLDFLRMIESWHMMIIKYNFKILAINKMKLIYRIENFQTFECLNLAKRDI